MNSNIFDHLQATDKGLSFGKANLMRCNAKTKAGKRCKREARAGSLTCSIHDKGNGVDVKSLNHEYDLVFPVAKRYSECLASELRKMLEVKDITLGVPMENRVKDWKSIKEKIERKQITLKRLEDLTDLIGIRLILLFKRDVDGVAELLNEAFTVLSVEDTGERLGDSQFGYQSIHYNVQMPESWLNVPTMSEFGKFQAEIQVRTISQHIWAASSHKLQYKQEGNVPPPVRRAIHRVSALLETVDLEFERVLQDRTAYVSKLNDELEDNLPLDVDSLKRALEDIWPASNSSSDDPYAELLSELAVIGVFTSRELKETIGNLKSQVLKNDQQFVRKYQDDESFMNKLGEDYYERIARGVWLTHVGLTRQAIGLLP